MDLKRCLRENDGMLLNKTSCAIDAWETTTFVVAVHAQEYVVLMDAANHTKQK